MQNQVEVLADDMGNVVRLSKNNPEYGFIRLGQTRSIITKDGWLAPKNLTTLVLGKAEDLTTYAKTLGKTLPGKIVVIESLEPFNSKDPDRDYKYAGQTGIICCQDGQPIYRKTQYTLDLNKEDVLVEHTNGDAIRAANETAFNLEKKPKKATTAEAFGLKTDDGTPPLDEVEEVTENKEVTDEVEELVEEEAETFEL
jgi:hypothetical protein